MNPKPLRWLFLLILPLGLLAQEEDIVELSPFSVSTERDSGYTPTVPQRPNVAITIKKPAHAVVMELALTNATDKQDVRTRELLATVETLTQATKADKGLRLEQREVQLRADSKRRFLSSKSNTASSIAYVALVGELDGTTTLFEVVNKMRNAISSAKLVGLTRTTEGPVSFLLRDADQYRQEILAKVFEDVNAIKKGIGPEFEVRLSGLDGPVQLRPCSEKEVELWIQYSFSIHSIRELENPKAGVNAAKR